MLEGNSIATDLIAQSHEPLEISSFYEKSSVIPGTEHCDFGTFSHVRFQTVIPRLLDSYARSESANKDTNSSFVTDE
jgi:hypothetical protein